MAPRAKDLPRKEGKKKPELRLGLELKGSVRMDTPFSLQNVMFTANCSHCAAALLSLSAPTP